MNKVITTVLIIVVIFLFGPFVVYIYNFWGYELSKDTEIWGQFGDYLNGTFMPLIALAGIAVTFLFRLISAEREQHKQRPFLHIGYWDFEDKIEIFMQNKGLGPLLIESYKIVNEKKNQDFGGIFEWLSKENLGNKENYRNYTGNRNNFVLSPGEIDQLFLHENNNGGEEMLNKLRESLKDLKIVVMYKDVYHKRMPIYERSLEWFGRNVPKKVNTKSREPRRMVVEKMKVSMSVSWKDGILDKH